MKTKIALIIICVVAFGVRLGLLWNTYGIVGNYGITTWHGEVARNIVEGRGFVADRDYVELMNKQIGEANYLLDVRDIEPPKDEKFEPVYQITPATPLLLAFTYWLFDDYRYIYLQILQALIDSLGCLVIYLLGKELFNKRVGIISAIIYALFLPIAFLSTRVIHDALMPFLVLCSLYLFILGVKRESIKHYVLSAIVTGISCYFQPTTIFLPIIFGMGLFIYSVRKIDIWHRLLNAIKVTMIMTCTVAIIVLPWIVRNYQVTGVLSANMRVATWAGLWEGIGEFPDNPIGAQLADDVALKVAKTELGYDVEYGSPEFDAVFKPKVLNLIKDDPLWYASAMIRRLPATVFYVNGIGFEEHPPQGMIWGKWEKSRVTWQNYKVALSNGTLIEFIKENPKIFVYWSSVGIFGFIPPITALVCCIFVRKEWRNIVLLLTLPVYFSLIHMATFVSGCGKTLLPGSIAFIVLTTVLVSVCYNKFETKARGIS